MQHLRTHIAYRYGAGIDDADLVIRFNNGPQHGFEAHVGRRTGLRILNNQWSQHLAGQSAPIRGTKVRRGQEKANLARTWVRERHGIRTGQTRRGLLQHAWSNACVRVRRVCASDPNSCEGFPATVHNTSGSH